MRWFALAVAGLLGLLASPAAAQTDNAAYEETLIAWALTQTGRELESAPEGKTLEEVVVAAEDVFAASDPWPGFLNWFHLRSRDGVIRREVLLTPGERWDPEKVAETERKLRGQFIFAVARVVAVKGKNGGVAALIITKDRWSLRLNSDYNLIGSTLQYLRLRPTEQNFLGRNQQLLLDMVLRLDTLYLGQQFQEQRVLGHNFYLGETAFIIFNRQTGRPEGSLGRVLVGRPLISLEQEWAASAQGDWGVSRRRVFRGPSVWQLPYPDEEAPTGTVPFVHDVREVSAFLSGTRSWGRAYKTDLTFSVGGYSYDYRPPGDSGLSEEQGTWLREKFLPRSEGAMYAQAQVRWYQAEYRVLRDIDTFSLSEDYQLGPHAYFGLTGAFPSPFTSDPHLSLGAAARYRWLWNENLLTAGGAIAARWSGTLGWVDRRYSFEVRNASPPIGGGRLVARALLDVRQRDLDNTRVLLGGANGLRGSGAEALSGRNLLLINVEYRARPFVFSTVYLGFVFFYDAGSAFDTMPNVTHTVGLGARILLPQFNTDVIRLDVGFVVNGPGDLSIDRFSSSYGQVTDIPSSPRFVDQPSVPKLNSPLPR
jgi:hypothetical protein